MCIIVKSEFGENIWSIYDILAALGAGIGTCLAGLSAATVMVARDWEGVEIQEHTQTKKFKSYPTPFSTKDGAYDAFDKLFILIP